MNRRLRYLRDRLVNALAMLRRGEFRSMLGAVWKEVCHRAESVRGWWIRRRQIDESEVPGSAYVDWRKLNPPGYRPTVSARPGPTQLEVDGAEIASQLDRIIGGLKITEKRRR